MGVPRDNLNFLHAPIKFLASQEGKGFGFFSSLDSVSFTKLSNKFYCFSVRAGSAIRSGLKDPLENKFLRESNSHRLLVAIVVIIESKVLFL